MGTTTSGAHLVAASYTVKLQVITSTIMILALAGQAKRIDSTTMPAFDTQRKTRLAILLLMFSSRRLCVVRSPALDLKPIAPRLVNGA